VGGGNDYLFFNKLLYFAEATVREIAQPAHNAEKFESILKQDTPLLFSLIACSMSQNSPAKKTYCCGSAPQQDSQIGYYTRERRYARDCAWVSREFVDGDLSLFADQYYSKKSEQSRQVEQEQEEFY